VHHRVHPDPALALAADARPDPMVGRSASPWGVHRALEVLVVLVALADLADLVKLRALPVALLAMPRPAVAASLGKRTKTRASMTA